MRAHIPIDRRTRREIERAVEEQVKTERHGMTRRVFKAFIYALNTEFGFGIHRRQRLIDAVNSVFNDTEQDELWRRIDHHIIEYMGIPFDYERTDIDGNLTDI